jgi:CubicO group peptidase (beta-lactamase class C family)
MATGPTTQPLPDATTGRSPGATSAMPGLAGSLDGLDALLAGAMERALIPGLAVAVVRDGRTLALRALGRASLELDVAARPDSVFPIASVTKAFTSVLVMKAVEDGRLSLDDRLADLAGDLVRPLPAAWRPVTVRQMLAHISGLPDLIASPLTVSWLADEREGALAAAAALPMQFEPGTEWRYNQTNYVLLGAILEGLHDRPFDEILSGTILAPLGLGATTYGDARDVVAGRGPWYTRLDLGGPEPRLADHVRPAWLTYPPFAHPCAGLNSTAAELAAFVDAVAGGRLLSPDTVKALWQVPVLADGRPAGPDPTSSVALGWLVEDLAGHTLAGGTGGGSVAFRHAVGERLTVAVLTNLQGGMPDAIATLVVALAMGVPAPM